MVQPENIETGWLPIAVMMAGQGWGVYFGPSVNDQAILLFQEGDKEVGFCIGYLPSDIDPPPHVPPTEVHLVQKTGAFVKLLADGTISLQSDANTFVRLAPGGAITSKGTWSHTGPITATGEGTFNGGHTVSQHTHTQPADSHGDTEQPTDKPTG